MGRRGKGRKKWVKSGKIADIKTGAFILNTNEE
jgi:hypothetical protein